MIDHVTSAGRDGDVFEPRHTTHGFRYVRVEGHPGDLAAGDVTGVVVHTDMPRTGWFTCSDDRINALHEAAVWSLRGNACDIPTDCPHRERAGGPATGSCTCPLRRSSTTWPGFRQVAARRRRGPVGRRDHREHVAGRARRGAGSPARSLNGSAGWGDAIVIVPWELYRAYGDASCWPSCGRTWSAGWTAPSDSGGRPAPARTGPVRPHERYLWDTGFHWGEWLEPGDDMSGPFEEFAGRDKSDVATAYYARSAELMSRIAAVLGRGQDAARYAASRPASGPHGRPSSSARTATSVRPPRPISCGR